MKIEKRNKSLEEFLSELDLLNLEKDMLFSDLEDDDVSQKEEQNIGQNNMQFNNISSYSLPEIKDEEEIGNT